MGLIATLSIKVISVKALSISTKYCYAECLVFTVMLNVVVPYLLCSIIPVRSRPCLKRSYSLKNVSGLIFRSVTKKKSFITFKPGHMIKVLKCEQNI